MPVGDPHLFNMASSSSSSAAAAAPAVVLAELEHIMKTQHVELGVMRLIDAYVDPCFVVAPAPEEKKQTERKKWDVDLGDWERINRNDRPHRYVPDPSYQPPPRGWCGIPRPVIREDGEYVTIPRADPTLPGIDRVVWVPRNPPSPEPQTRRTELEPFHERLDKAWKFVDFHRIWQENKFIVEFEHKRLNVVWKENAEELPGDARILIGSIMPHACLFCEHAAGYRILWVDIDGENQFVTVCKHCKLVRGVTSLCERDEVEAGARFIEWSRRVTNRG